MDKMFLIDSNKISYKQLIDYVNNKNNTQYTSVELSLLDTIKSLVVGNVENVDDLIYNIYNSNKLIKLHTSGTTGKPKEVYQSFKNMVRNIKVSKDRMDDVWALFYNPNLMAGYQVIFQSLLNKNTLINMFGYRHEDTPDRLNKFKVTHISATPTLYKMIISDNIVFNYVKQVTLGGEASTEKLHELIKKHFPNAKVKNIYASTEVGSLFASNGDLFKISDSNKHLIKIEGGELLIHKDIVGESEIIKYEDNWYRTGDLVEMVNSTHFKIIGRRDNTIKIAGYTVNLESIENEIQQMDFVKVCKVYPKKNSILGNILCCDMVTKKNITVKNIKNRLKGRLNQYEIPSKIRFVESIEINKSGKIKR